MRADWTNAAEAVLSRGWVRLVEALPGEIVHRLIDARRPGWHPLPVEEGTVRQEGFGSYLPVGAAEAIVTDVGDEIVASLTEAATPLGMVAVPPFNEVTWTRYPAGRGHITAHRDPPAYGGVIAVVNLGGTARFRVWDEPGSSRSERWWTASGDVVVLRGHAWPASTSSCPRHEVDPPPGRERMIMTLRYNGRGAGGGYDVGPD